MEEESGISFTDIIRTVLSRKWLALILALAITIVGTLGLYFGYNHFKTQYMCTFSIDFPGSAEATPVYPDGTPFNYRDLISRRNLIDVIASDEEWLNTIDVEKMYSKGDIAISRYATEQNSDVTYTLTISSRYFKNIAEAQKFVDAVLKTPINYINSLAVEQNLYLANYDLSDYYEDRAGALLDQLDYLNEQLESISQSTVGSLKSECVKLIAGLEQFSRSLASQISTMRQNGYVHNKDEVLKSYNAQISVMETEKTSLLREYELLAGAIKGESGYGAKQTRVSVIAGDTEQTDFIADRLASLSARIAKTEAQISLYKSYVGEDGTGSGMVENTDFGANLDSLKTDLSAYTQNYELILSRYYTSTSNVAYASVLSSSGDLSIILCFILSFIAGLVIAAVVAYLVGKYVKNKSGDNKNTDLNAAPTADGTENNAE